jgi:hypothetical protein
LAARQSGGANFALEIGAFSERVRHATWLTIALSIHQWRNQANH